MNIKVSTIARLGALIVALVNQSLAVFGHEALPFTESMAYQVVSLVVTVIIVAINAWYNNDITKLAILSGNVLDALQDGKITEEEIKNVLEKSANSVDEEVIRENFLIKTINAFIEKIRSKKSK